MSQAGLLITAFAAGMIVGAPAIAIAIATLRLPRRSTLVLALIVFALGHVVAALSPSFAVVQVLGGVGADLAGQERVGDVHGQPGLPGRTYMDA
ncbi:hypothetical protein [Streptomyces sp. DSM 40750]|uniref:hypothetical protein n=1 Tax=Streptomyces sp. DSM 40750 TaxID=2801030 RepID=UPI0027D4679E|nr:hypothetical protein [Streptomyces sp. DSM 40750]